MTWVRIDPETSRVELQQSVQLAQRALDVLLKYGELSTAGLGDLAGPTADFLARSQQVLVDSWKVYLDEMTLMVERLVPLLNDQRAASVVGVVGSAPALFGGWTAPVVGAPSATIHTGLTTSMTISDPPWYTNAKNAEAQGNFTLAAQHANLGAVLGAKADRMGDIWLAPAGGRAMSPYGPSVGYERLNANIEVPIRYS